MGGGQSGEAGRCAGWGGARGAERGSILNDQSFHLQLFHNWSPARVIQLHRTRLLQFVESREFFPSFYSKPHEKAGRLPECDRDQVLCFVACFKWPSVAERRRASPIVAKRPFPALKPKPH